MLHTAADLAAEAGFPLHEPLVIDRLVVSPDGKHVLVALDRAGAYELTDSSSEPRLQPAGALVVLGRAGDVEAVSRSRPKRGFGWAAWTPTGELALGLTMQSATLNTPDRVLTYWDLRSDPVDIALPGAFDNTLLTPCVWGPASDSMLCGDDRGWFDVRAKRREVTRLSSVTGRPLVWLR